VGPELQQPGQRDPGDGNQRQPPHRPQLDKGHLPGRDDLGALRLRTLAVNNRRAADFPEKDPAVVLELDYTVLMPWRG